MDHNYIGGGGAGYRSHVVTLSQGPYLNSYKLKNYKESKVQLDKCKSARVNKVNYIMKVDIN